MRRQATDRWTTTDHGPDLEVVREGMLREVGAAEQHCVVVSENRLGVQGGAADSKPSATDTPESSAASSRHAAHRGRARSTRAA